MDMGELPGMSNATIIFSQDTDDTQRCPDYYLSHLSYLRHWLPPLLCPVVLSLLVSSLTTSLSLSYAL